MGVPSRKRQSPTAIPILHPTAPSGFLKCLLLNARSVYANLQAFKILLHDNFYDLIFLTETWLTSSHVDSLLVDGSTYAVIRRDRGSRAGGLMVVFKNHLPCKLVGKGEFSETLCVDLETMGLRFVLGYIPDKYNLEEIRNLCSDIKYFHKTKALELVLLGDFNMSFVNWNVPSASHRNGKFFI